MNDVKDVPYWVSAVAQLRNTYTRADTKIINLLYFYTFYTVKVYKKLNKLLELIFEKIYGRE